MDWIKKHWLALLGIAGPVISLVRKGADLLGYADEAIEHASGQSWLDMMMGRVWHIFLSAPGWLLLVLTLGGLLLIWWDFRRNPKIAHVHHVTIQAETRPRASIAMEVKRPSDEKISIQDAMMFILNRKWPAPDDKLLEGQSQSASDALQSLRERAGSGRLVIYGIEYNGQLPFAIPSEFWIDHQIDYMTAVFSNDPASIKTESAITLQASKRYKHLQVVKSEVEALWPPA